MRPTGWLSYYQRGYLHRDGSIGNVLKLKEPGARNKFTTKHVGTLLGWLNSQNRDGPRGGDGKADENLKDWETLVKNVQGDQERAIVQLAQEVEKRAELLDVSNECKAILSDCDMAADMVGYFDQQMHDRVVSVSRPGFMFITNAYDYSREPPSSCPFSSEQLWK